MSKTKMSRNLFIAILALVLTVASFTSCSGNGEKELCNSFSCRYAVIVHSFAGGASGAFESHWDNAIRNADPIQNLTPTSN